jgi:DNA end-binding protein Ku
MEDSELAAIAKFVMRDQQHLGALRVRDGVVTLEQLYFADEIRPIDEIKASKGRVGKQELQMAAQLIESWTSEWKPKKYKDTYRDELCAVIKAKRKGDEVHRAAEVEEDDLLDALRASIERSRGKSRSRGRRTAPTTSSGNGRRDLSELSKADLDKRAKQPGSRAAPR